MNGETIKSFMIGLGFDVDASSFAAFNKAILSATVRVAALYTSIKLASTGIFYSISKISESFEEIGYNLRLVAPAVNKMLLLRAAMLDAYKRAGIDLTKVVKESILFNLSLAKTKYALEAVYKSVGARFLPLLTKQMDIFRLKIFANMPKIQNIMESFIKFVFRAFEVTVILGQRMWSVLGIVWDFLKKLDDATGGWSTKILGLIALWKALNLSFIATPLGALLTGLLGILALYDDFKVFQSGGESFFNWAPFLPVINAVKDALSGVKSMLDAISFIVFGLIDSFVKLFHLDFAGFKETMKNLWGDIIALIQRTISTIGDFLSVGGAVKNWAVGIFSGNAQAQPTLPPRTGLGNTQHVSQETNINVSGSADASATGKAVAGEQSRVNFDMTRNLLGATR